MISGDANEGLPYVEETAAMSAATVSSWDRAVARDDASGGWQGGVREPRVSTGRTRFVVSGWLLQSPRQHQRQYACVTDVNYLSSMRATDEGRTCTVWRGTTPARVHGQHLQRGAGGHRLEGARKGMSAECPGGGRR